MIRKRQINNNYSWFHGPKITINKEQLISDGQVTVVRGGV